MRDRIFIVGGGLAGLAAASALAGRGFPVSLLESKTRLGGRAGSYQDPVSGDLVDLCQHVSMGCCTNFAHFCQTLGIRAFLQRQPALTFMTPDRRVSRFAADRLPAPLHLARSFARLHTLTWAEKWRVARGLTALQRNVSDEDPPFSEWLEAHGQTPRIIDRFWGLVLTSALNETVDRVGVRPARKVFIDGFLSHRRASEIEIPSVPLGRLYGPELQQWFAQHGVEIVLGATVRRIHMDRGLVTSLELRTGERLEAWGYVSAVPFERLLDLLEVETIETHRCFADLRNLGHSPITSVHCWFDRSATELPHVVLVDCLGQWVFNRGRTESGEYYLQVVVSAARELLRRGRDETERLIVDELRHLFPNLRDARLCRVKAITDQTATFSAVPGVDRWRPSQTTPINNLVLAGDWTATGWPATMEGAVRSGYLAAEAMLRRMGQPASLVKI